MYPFEKKNTSLGISMAVVLPSTPDSPCLNVHAVLLARLPGMVQRIEHHAWLVCSVLGIPFGRRV